MNDPRRSTRLLSLALGLTFAYMLVEVVAGLLTGSLALLADAGHMLSDSGALVVALAAARVAARPPDARQTMGYQRAEVLGAAMNAGALLVLGAWIAVEAMGRLSVPSEIAAEPMMAVAALGLVLNLGVAKVLHADAHTLNTRAALLHVLGDALGSVGALGAGAAVYLFGTTWADPAVSLVIAAILVGGAVRVLREVGGVLMQSAPGHVDVARMARELGEVDGVVSVHDLHVWTLRPGEDVLTVHVVVSEQRDVAQVCAVVRDRVRRQVPTAHVTVQPEPPGTPCGPTLEPDPPHEHGDHHGHHHHHHHH